MMWRAYLIVALACTCAVFAAGWRREMVAKGVAQERARIADSILVVAKQERNRIDSVLVPIIKTIPKYIDRVVTERDTVLQHLTDTMVIKEYITQTVPAAMQACAELTVTCDAYRTNAEKQFAAYEAKLRALPVGETRSEKVVSRAAWFALGGLLGYLGGNR